VFQSLIIAALEISLLIWIGMWILLDRRYKWSDFILYVVLTFIFTYYGLSLIGQWVRPLVFVFTFTIANFRKNDWIPEARTNFFYLSIVFLMIILGRPWSEVIVFNAISFSYEYELLFLLLFQIVIGITLFFFARSVLKKLEITDFVSRIDDDYRSYLLIGTGTVLSLYYGVTFIPEAFGINSIQPVYLTLLTIIAFGLILLFTVIIKKEMILIRYNATLADINSQLISKQKEIAQKEALIENLDNKIKDVGRVQKQLRDFEHGQRELIIALAGGIKSGDKKAMYELLGQYDAKVQKVLKQRPYFPDVNQLVTSELMPVRCLLLSKADQAIKERVRFTVEVSTEIIDIGMPVLDFIDILGVWLNNAIEEAMYTEKKWVHTSFILDEDPDGVTILEVRVTNSCRENTVCLTIINKQGVTTKGEGRGCGLPIVEEMMIKNENIYVSTRVSDGKFMQLLEIVFDVSEEQDEPEINTELEVHNVPELRKESYAS